MVKFIESQNKTLVFYQYVFVKCYLQVSFHKEIIFPTQFLIRDTDLWWQMLDPNPFIVICNSQKL